MTKNKSIQVSTFLSHEIIERKIYLIRGRKIMLDRDLSDLYEVGTKDLNRAVKRNIYRFPGDFMFQLTPEEAKRLRCQFGTSKGRGGRRYLPYAFSEHGILMLSSVLNSKKAVEVNIQIMRIFIKLREILLTHKNLQNKIKEMAKQYDKKFVVVFNAIKILLDKAKNDGKTRRFDL